MRIREDVIYPHPLLTEDVVDYQEGKISFSIEIERETDKDFFLRAKTKVSHNEIEGMIKNNKVAAALDIECQATYFSDLTQIKLGDYELPPFPRNEFSGNVDLRLLLYSNEEIKDFFSPDFHTDYGKEKFYIRKGDILGFSKVKKILFPFPKISYNQIFELKLGGDNISENEFKIIMDEDEKIQIIAGSKIFSKIQESRNIGWGRNHNLASIYSLSLLEVIYSIIISRDAYSDRKWYAVLDQTLQILGYNLDQPDDLDALSAAQALFSFPYNGSYEGIKLAIA